MSVARYYAWLSWFQDAAGVVGHDTGQASRSTHRLLMTTGGGVSGDVLHERLLQALARRDGPPSAPAALDAGCGLGGTTFFLAGRVGGTYLGLTLSPAQRDRAAAEADRRGLAAACRFVVRSYDDPLEDLLPDGVDLVVAIESLAHAPDPVTSIGRLARLLRPGGRLVVVDDMPAPDLDDADADVAAFRRGWLCPAGVSGAACAAALQAAGLAVVHDEDLTPLVRLREARHLAGLVRLNRMAQTVLRFTPARVLVESLHGGLMLERLYRRRLMQYRMLLAERSGEVS